jgi:sec-independent protein translocase protein TatC
MTFLEHLEELRWTLVRSAIAIAVGHDRRIHCEGLPVFDQIDAGPEGAWHSSRTVLSAPWVDRNWEWNDSPMCPVNLASTLQNISMSGQFFTHLIVSFVAGFIIAFPYVLWEMWRFVGPGLHPTERRSLRGVVAFATVLFLTGVLFGYYMLAPLSIQFFGAYQVSGSVQNAVALDSYVAMITSVTLWTGIVFEMPLVILFLTKAGIVGPEFLRTYRKHAFVAILIIAAILTPPDVVSQLIVSGPLMVLYEFSILVSARAVRSKSGQVTSGTLTRQPV